MWGTNRARCYLASLSVPATRPREGVTNKCARVLHSPAGAAVRPIMFIAFVAGTWGLIFGLVLGIVVGALLTIYTLNRFRRDREEDMARRYAVPQSSGSYEFNYLSHVHDVSFLLSFLASE